MSQFENSWDSRQATKFVIINGCQKGLQGQKWPADIIGNAVTRAEIAKKAAKAGWARKNIYSLTYNKVSVASSPNLKLMRGRFNRIATPDRVFIRDIVYLRS